MAMRIYLLSHALALLLVACSTATGLRPAGQRHGATFGGGSASNGRIGMDFWDGEHIGFPVTVNGVTTAALLDSGLEVTVLDKAFAERVGARIGGRSRVMGIAGQESGQVATGVDIAIRSIHLAGITAGVFDLSGQEKFMGRPMSIVLGEDVFDQAIVDIDPADSTIAFHDPEQFRAPSGATRLPLKEVGGLRVVDVSVEGHPSIPVVFDLGSGAPLTLVPAYWREHVRLDGRTTSTSLAAGIGGTLESSTCTLASVQFAGVVLTSVPADLEPGPAAWLPTGALGYVGFPVLRRFRLIVDYPHNSLYLVPNREAIARPFARDRLGLSLAKEGETLQVAHVARGSPAAAAGFRAGDRIAAIGEKPARAWARLGLNALRNGPAGTAVTLRMSDGSVRRVVLKDYF